MNKDICGCFIIKDRATFTGGRYYDFLLASYINEILPIHVVTNNRNMIDACLCTFDEPDVELTKIDLFTHVPKCSFYIGSHYFSAHLACKFGLEYNRDMYSIVYEPYNWSDRFYKEHGIDPSNEYDNYVQFKNFVRTIAKRNMLDRYKLICLTENSIDDHIKSLDGMITRDNIVKSPIILNFRCIRNIINSVKPDNKYITIINRFDKKKNWDFAAQVLKVLLNKFKDKIGFIICDSVHEVRKLLHNYSVDLDRIRFYANVHDEFKFSILRRSAILVNTSIFEGLGMQVIESAVLGTNAVALPIPTIRETSSFVDNIVLSDKSEYIDTCIDLINNDKPNTLDIDSFESKIIDFIKNNFVKSHEKELERINSIPYAYELNKDRLSKQYKISQDYISRFGIIWVENDVLPTGHPFYIDATSSFSVHDHYVRGSKYLSYMVRSLVDTITCNKKPASSLSIDLDINYSKNDIYEYCKYYVDNYVNFNNKYNNTIVCLFCHELYNEHDVFDIKLPLYINLLISNKICKHKNMIIYSPSFINGLHNISDKFNILQSRSINDLLSLLRWSNYKRVLFVDLNCHGCWPDIEVGRYYNLSYYFKGKLNQTDVMGMAYSNIRDISSINDIYDITNILTRNDSTSLCLNVKNGIGDNKFLKQYKPYNEYVDSIKEGIDAT